MDWNEIWKIVLGVIAGVGGIGVIFLAIVKFASNMIAERLSQKYELKMSMALEKYKSNLENKIYMSKAKFDAEFELYRQLSQCFVILVKQVSLLFPVFTKDARDDFDTYKSFHDECVDAIVKAQDELYASAPFITKEVYDKFLEIENLCKTQLSDFQNFRLRPDAEDYRKECKDAFKETYKRTKDIQDRFEQLLASLRGYISKLDVIV